MQSVSKQSRGWRLPDVPRRIVLGIVCLDLLVLLVSIALLSESRVEARRKAEHAWSNLVSTLERDLSRHLGRIDLLLRGMAATIQVPDPGHPMTESYKVALSAQIGATQTDGLFLVLDANGSLVASSEAFSSAEQTFAGREYFEVHRQRQDVGTYVSLSDTSDRGTQGIAISRPIASPDGLFRGLVVAHVPLTDFDQIMRRLDLGADGTVSLLRADGQFLARYPAANGPIGLDMLPAVRTLRTTLSTASAQFIATAESDGLERLYTYQRMALQRLILVGAIPTGNLYATWWWQVGASVACILTLHAAAVAVFLVGRGRASGQVLTLGAPPEVIKPLDDLTTDSTTGLLSRLSFESRLNQEWQHAIRHAHPLSLAILDIDHMEAYNTCFGRRAGDELLARIDACMTEHVLEKGDSAARFGGNELALLLPKTDMDGASTLTELLRASVDELGLVHAASPKAHVTVSIGWSTCTPKGGQEPGLLLAAAGRALRTAKQGGRNRVVGAPVQLVNTLEP